MPLCGHLASSRHYCNAMALVGSRFELGTCRVYFTSIHCNKPKSMVVVGFPILLGVLPTRPKQSCGFLLAWRLPLSGSSYSVMVAAHEQLVCIIGREDCGRHRNEPVAQILSAAKQSCGLSFHLGASTVESKLRLNLIINGLLLSHQGQV